MHASMNSKPPNQTSKRRPLLLILAAVLLLSVAAGYFLRSPDAPRLSGSTISGARVTPENLTGKPYLVNFWATSCVTCVKEMPDLIAVHQEFAAKGYQTIAVAMSYDRPDYLQTFVKERALPFLVIHDLDNAWSKAYGDVSVTPTTFVVDAKGRIVKRYVGEPDFKELRRLISRELG